MKKAFLLLALCLVSWSSFAQLTTVVTDKSSEAMGKYKAFVLVDQTTQMVLSRTAVKYNPDKEMPQCYFSGVIPTETGITDAANFRFMAINALPVVDGAHWVICENEETKTTIFSRRKFLSDFRTQYLWIPIIEGDYVIFLNMKGRTTLSYGGYLKINEDGSYSSAKSRNEASRWKLIYKS